MNRTTRIVFWIAGIALAACTLAAATVGITRTLRRTGSSAAADNDVDPESAHPATETASVASKLKLFRSQEEFQRYLDELATMVSKRSRAQGKAASDSPPAGAAPAPAAAAKSEAKGADGITNNQEAGVDEGDIVKVHGDHLVVLRRGRLFTVAIGSRELHPVSMVDASAPGTTTQGWYDEMLVQGDTIVVIGYSYKAQSTEIGLFDIDGAGTLRHRRSYYLRSNDYYSSRNYASRLVGNKLILYMPYAILGRQHKSGGAQLATTFPAVRASDVDDWSEIITATQTYRPVQSTDNPVLHTVVTCDLGSRALRCSAKGILGPWSRSFHVSQNAIYVWVSGSATQGEDLSARATPGSVVYRMPLDGTEPGALRVSGSPIDQFSFKESDDGMLNVLVQAGGGGDSMWRPEAPAGDLALLRVAVSAITTELGSAPSKRYTPLPGGAADGWSMQNRFVGDYLVYGQGAGWRRPHSIDSERVYVHPYHTGGDTIPLQVPHGVDRIEAMGRDAVVVGTDGTDLVFTALHLSRSPSLGARYTRAHAAQGETRSHGFFFLPQSADEGLLGLPIRKEGSSGVAQLRYGSAEVLFLRYRDDRFASLGSLEARSSGQDDHCKASCVDWYGNARPIFLRGRIMALLGYELVEGRLDAGSLAETARTNFLIGSPLRAD